MIPTFDLGGLEHLAKLVAGWDGGESALMLFVFGDFAREFVGPLL